MLNLTYFSHSAFLVEADSIKILIDPFFTGNPTTPKKLDEVSADYIVLTHAHGDHLGDALEIAKKCNSTIIAVNELANYVASKGVRAHNMHIGGSYLFPFGRVKFTIAHHGSSSPEGLYMGEPAGVLLFIQNKIIYHAGDTGLFYDMKLIGEMNKISVALLPIGDNFTMDIQDALKATEFLNAELTIPMHYNTFPIIEADPDKFVEKAKALGFNSRKLDYGETLNII
ncbi:MAG: metal-dependent hydrolase [Ignavibacteria bacterium]|nr:metal-dependent hydrolase [Ignavibacteria bacterium]